MVPALAAGRGGLTQPAVAAVLSHACRACLCSVLLLVA